jgi:hypothetical protein
VVIPYRVGRFMGKHVSKLGDSAMNTKLKLLSTTAIFLVAGGLATVRASDLGVRLPPQAAVSDPFYVQAEVGGAISI